jgi:predicted DNA-binding antitoxin AbrB/MazE fold protein
MQKTFEAVYENGVLRPLEALELSNWQHVRVTIDATGIAEDIAAYFDADAWEASKSDTISLAEVRHALSSIPGSLSEAVISSRDERF